MTSWDKNHHNFYYQLTTWTHATTTTTTLQTDPIRPEPSRRDCVCLCLLFSPCTSLLSRSSLSPCTRLRQLCACAGARQNNNKADTHTQHKKQRDTKTGHCLNGSAERKSNSLLSSFPSLSLCVSDNSRLPASLVCRCERRQRTLPAYERGRQRAAIKI